jgi:hypothetical protein
MSVYVDPVTGQFTAPPPVAAGQQPLPPQMQAPPAPLVEVPAPAGGALLRLNGQFVTDIVATKTENGIRVHCEDASPAAPR